MDEREFYDYLQEHYTLGGTTSRLISNILAYIKDENFVDAEDAQTHLKSLLDGAFGIEEREIKLYRAPECEECGEYAPYGLQECDDKMLCSDCEAHWDIADEEEGEGEAKPYNPSLHRNDDTCIYFRNMDECHCNNDPDYPGECFYPNGVKPLKPQLLCNYYKSAKFALCES